MEILYDDGVIMAVYKPAGLLTHQSKISPDRDSLVDRLRNQFENPPSPVHRLDRPTSGIVLCAHSKETARTLGLHFSEGRVHKKYMAIVRGYTPDSDRIDRPLRKDGTGEPQNARTIYKTIKSIEINIPNNKYETSRYSLVEVVPETGRFHQIRRHMAGIGHPLIGDTTHGDLRHNRIFGSYFSIERLLLHSANLRFPHPRSGKEMAISAPLPEDLTAIFNLFLGQT